MHTYFVKFEQLIRQNNVPERRVDCGFDSRQRHKIWEISSVGLERLAYNQKIRGFESLISHKEVYSNLTFRTSLLNQYSERLLPVKLGYSSVVEQQIHILQVVGSIPTIPTIKSERRAHHLLLSNHSPISKVAKFLILFRPAIYFLLQINRKMVIKYLLFYTKKCIFAKKLFDKIEYLIMEGWQSGRLRRS